MAAKKKWWVAAREEGRLCRLCREPVAKHYWNNKDYDHLCPPCYMRESILPHSRHWKIGR